MLKFTVLFTLVALPAWSQDVQTCDAPGRLSLLMPIRGTHTQPGYSPTALSEKDEGRVWLKIGIDVVGKAEDVSIARTSGAAELDRLAVEHVKTHWLWQPPLYDCKPAKVEAWAFMDFSLKNTPVSPPDFRVYPSRSEYRPEMYSEVGSTKFTVGLSDDGKPQDIHLDQGVGFVDLDKLAFSLVQRSVFKKIKGPAPVKVEVYFMPPIQVRQ